jgi:hypothetical protein
MQLAVEAIVVGVILVVIWALLNPILGNFTDNPLVILFIVGALTHFGFEAAGANKWYCKNGHACT